ncbi:HAD-IIIA family hydrolase [Candidatus Berkelbacteria bacterium]|nr:HAD-IIIA family hydrolase [Candidatus Berkelbacteria bacterium]MBI4029776.1 HAD-IIIA family hydrolase [Candidatus Berkelbacteria bacterium]
MPDSNEPIRIVACDRDGVINPMVFKKWSWIPEQIDGIWDSPMEASELILLPEAGQAIRRLNEAGIFVVLFSDQPHIGRGKYPLRTHWAIRHRLPQLLQEHRAWLDGFYYCLHTTIPTPYSDHRFVKECDCQKPGTGSLKRASEDFVIPFSQFLVIDDSVAGIKAGQQFGCRTILISNPDTEKWHGIGRHPPDWNSIKPTVVKGSLQNAVDWILGQQDQSQSAKPTKGG